MAVQLRVPPNASNYSVQSVIKHLLMKCIVRKKTSLRTWSFCSADEFNCLSVQDFNRRTYSVVEAFTTSSITLKGVQDTFALMMIAGIKNKMKTTTTVTNDGVPVPLLKLHADHFVSLLHRFCINRIDGKVPFSLESVRHYTSSPGRSQKNIEKYRPISLLPKVSHMSERILLD